MLTKEIIAAWAVLGEIKSNVSIECCARALFYLVYAGVERNRVATLSTAKALDEFVYFSDSIPYIWSPYKPS